MEDKKQVIDCFEEQLKDALNNTSGSLISINHRREIWELILKAIQDTKQALTIKSEKEQALEIIVKKDVEIEYLKTCIYNNGVIDIEEYNAYVDGDKELTREEIELVAKVVKEIGENESK